MPMRVGGRNVLCSACNIRHGPHHLNQAGAHAHAAATCRTAEPKERQRHHGKCKELMAQLEQHVTDYNMLAQALQQLGHAYGTTTVEAVRQRLFRWQAERAVQYGGEHACCSVCMTRCVYILQPMRDAMPYTCKHTVVLALHLAADARFGNIFRRYGVGRALQLCEADNNVQRIKEELGLLVQEMRAHVSFYRNLMERLEQLEAAMLAPVGGASRLEAAGYHMLPGAGRYQPSAQQLVSDPLALSGAVTFLRVAKHEVSRKLQLARTEFAKLSLAPSEEASIFGAGGSGARGGGDAAAGGGAGGGNIAHAGGGDDDSDSEDGDSVPPDAYVDD